jgi:hypothetical protein
MALAALWLACVGTTLSVTVPSYQQNVVLEEDPDTGETVPVWQCYTPGDTLRGTLMGILYGQPVAGGGWRAVDSLNCRGLRGQRVVLWAPWPGNFYVLWRGDAGLSCATNQVTVLPGEVTSVAVDAALDPVEGDVLLFDVAGRRVGAYDAAFWGEIRRRRGLIRKARLASGLYFARARTRSGAEVSGRVMVVR